MSVNGQSLKSVFEKMPREMIYGLTKEMKEELFENTQDTSTFVSTLIYERIKRQEINTEYISLKTSDAGTTTLRLLPLINNSKIVCVVKTIDSGISDSEISFFTENWELIDDNDLFPPKNIDWFIKEDIDRTSEKFQHAMLALSIMKPMMLTLSPNEDVIKVEYDPKSFLSIDDYKLVEPFLTKKAKMLYWDKTRFK